MSKVIIVGAGAAGMFAAGTAVRAGHVVQLIEHAKKPAQKLAITGKGRCNVTNDCDVQEFLKNVRHNSRFLYSAITAFSPADVMQLFSEDLGILLKVERGRRVFPQSDKAEDIIAALLQYAKKAEYIHGEVKKLLLSDDGIKILGVLLGDGKTLMADAVIIATGGVSYPTTGSTGIGYELAKQAGHSIVKPVPSLVSLVERGNTAKKMMGLSLKNVELSLLENKKVVFRQQGEMIFTHFGLSGPLVLSASAYIEDLQKNKYSVKIDLKPALTAEQLDSRILRDFTEAQNKNVMNCLDKLLPNKMRPVMLELWGVSPERKVNSITKQERRALVDLMKAFPIEIGGRGDLAHAVITAGGVTVKEVDPKTMQSKLVQGLYFAGEVLDVDAYTGGYNLQIAWCTAYVAAQSIL